MSTIGPSSPRQVIVVTGAGSGLGQAVAEKLALAGHIVYAGMRGLTARSAERAAAANRFAAQHEVTLRPLELDVLSDTGCRAAIDQVLVEQGRLEVLVNNAGMLMSGVAEAFTAEQFLTILDTNVVSWLRMNRAVLPVMRRQGAGTLVYISSTTAHIVEPFMATYIASKAAGEAFAESIGFEVTPFGIDTIIVVPGAFTHGTQHFAHTTAPAEPAVAAQYGDLASAVAEIPARLEAIDIAHQGHTADVSSVGDALVDVLRRPRGTRPRRVIVDAQHKGVEDIDAVRTDRQRAFFTALGIDHLIDLPDRP
jgi:NAD(P)-dependent dehydrogenase (short-subunit alcohol dehydrogenase family)